MSKERIIHEDHNGVKVSANQLAHPTKMREFVEGHAFQIFHSEANIKNILATLVFQNGPIKENGINGITNEALTAILIYRLEILNDKFPCEENRVAIAAYIKALKALTARTTTRIEQGVEGTDQPHA